MSRILRTASLAMLFAWGIIALGVGISALTKARTQKRAIIAATPSGVTVSINTQDVTNSGIVLTVVSGLLALTSLLALLAPLLRGASARHNRVVGGTIAFLSVWLFATLVPFTHFFATHSADVSARIGTVALPASAVQTVEASLGVTGVYKHIFYLRLVAILPWFTFLFGAIAAVVHLTARDGTAGGVDDDNEKRASGV